MTRSNPTVARIRLAARLREARERAGRTLDDLSRFLGVSAPQASRLDSGARGFRPQDIPHLAKWYGFDEADAKVLLALAEEGRRREWWQQVDLPDPYRTLIGMEQAARSIAEYGGNVVPGLLQTREYARAATEVAYPELRQTVGPEEIDQAVEVRMRRQAILGRIGPPTLTVVIDEVVLARGARNRVVMRDQLRHLRDAADLPGVTVQVIPFEFGLHPGGNSHFILLGMGGGVPDVCYSEGLRGGVVSSDDDELSRYRVVWTELRGIALDPFASRDRIDRYLVDLT